MDSNQFSYGNESSVIEFSRDQEFEMDDESGTTAQQQDYDAETKRHSCCNNMMVMIQDIYTLNFSTNYVKTGENTANI